MLQNPRLSRLSRRALLAGACAAALPLPVHASAPWPGSAIPASGLDFTIQRQGSDIGTHQVRFTPDGQDLVVDIAIEMRVKIAFVTVFRYTHSNQEIWRDGRLIRLEARTDDDGREHRVLAQAEGGRLIVEGSGGRFEAPADTMPSSYWNPGMTQVSQMLNTQKGELEAVRISRGALETVSAGGRSVPARRWRMQASLEVDMWYAEPGDRWVDLAFIARGEEITYQPAPSLLASLG